MANVLKPLGKRLTVKRDAVEKTTPSGLVLPEGADRPPQTGTILDIGPDVGRRHQTGMGSDMLDPLMTPAKRLNPGDRVVFITYAGVEYKHEGETILILNEDDVIATIAAADEDKQHDKAHRAQKKK